MDKCKVISYIEESFLSELLTKNDVTDISYNGVDVFYVSNLYGRMKSNIKLEQIEAKDFIRQISNLSEKQFSFASPILDVTVGRYRINATHQSIGKVNNDEAITFSLRIASLEPKINEGSDFLTEELESLFSVLVKSGVSLLIGGTTGSGKTEFQKYLIRRIENNSRVIVIDNVSELEQTRDNPNIDLTFWCADDRNNLSSVSSLIKNALRCNPDWLIIAESRGGEMEDVLNSALTGIPIISTLHSFDIFSMPDRVVSMVMMNDKRSIKSEIYFDLKYHIRFYVYVKKEVDQNGLIHRYVSSVGEILENGDMHLIYQRVKNKKTYAKISKNNQKLLIFDENNTLFVKTFIGEKQ